MHKFGGNWSKEKLEKIRKYLPAYTKIFKANPRAQHFRTIYVDAFAGSGYHVGANNTEQHEEEEFMKGSTRIALESEPPFDNYLFIEKNPSFAQELLELQKSFPTKSIQIVNDEANSFLKLWTKGLDWSANRAVVFLDPYGMQVSWNLIENLGRTKGIDLWILFPLGVAINRMLTKREPPPQEWEKSLTRFFGSDDWKTHFYKTEQKLTLFGEESEVIKDADFDKINQYFSQRLNTAFRYVAQKPLILRNSTNSPIYALYFATHNETGLKIASHILK